MKKILLFAALIAFGAVVGAGVCSCDGGKVDVVDTLVLDSAVDSLIPDSVVDTLSIDSVAE